jgi:hypothetical protein
MCMAELKVLRFDNNKVNPMMKYTIILELLGFIKTKTKTHTRVTSKKSFAQTNMGVGLCCLTPLSTIFQLYHGVNKNK